MCLIAFAIGTDPSLPLLLAGNRDEFFDRPTEALHRWPDAPGIWAGRDRRDGGTWLGISDNGRVALLTNVRSANPGPGRRSRGELPVRWLRGGESVDGFVAALDPGAYGGFNLVIGDLETQAWHWLCNRDPATPHSDNSSVLQRRPLTPGIYGLSNAAMDTPWPKTQRLKAALHNALTLAMDGEHWQQPLCSALSDTQLAAVGELPRTGVSTEVERLLSSPFVQMPERGYGTRSSLLMRVQRTDVGQFLAELHEWTHPPTGWSEQSPARHQLRW